MLRDEQGKTKILALSYCRQTICQGFALMCTPEVKESLE